MSGLDNSQVITDEASLEAGGEHEAAKALDEEMARRGVSTPHHPIPDSPPED